ncbi:unnamed protein product, partial [Sphenostylis stenocarpa]
EKPRKTLQRNTHSDSAVTMIRTNMCRLLMDHGGGYGDGALILGSWEFEKGLGLG